MKRVLLVKTSSMGDVIHALPAVTDAMRAAPGIRFDWVVEEAFAEIPGWHAAVDVVIPVATRRWRRHPVELLRSGEWRQFRAQIGARTYDCVIDAQGLMKSAALARFARGPVCGYRRDSVREPPASLAYQRRYAVGKDQHAVERIRELVALSLGYDKPETPANYGIERRRFGAEADPPYVLFLHGTTRAGKHWPDEHWQALCRLLGEFGISVKVPWGSAAEHRRATVIAAAHRCADVPPRANLAGLAALIAGARAAVAVDTGPGHLAAALGVPTLSLYGPTSPHLTGTRGSDQLHLRAQDFAHSGPPRVQPALFAPLTPAVVFARLRDLVGQP